MESPVSFGLWLKERRKQLDLTQVDLAHRVGCSVMTIRKIEAEERRPSRQMAELLADCLTIPPEQRALFVQVARGERRVDRLPTFAPLFPQSPLSLPNLPIPPAPLLGREHELAAIARLLHDPACHLVTLVGPGGIGKTRLALEAAIHQRQRFADGIFFVPLIGVNATEFIIPTIADALGFTFYGPADPKVQLLNYLREKQMLIVLDNFEQLLESAGLLAEILGQTPGSKLLVTSREQLNLRMEWVFQVQGLHLPKSTQPADLEASSAAMLFLQRARQAWVDFTLTAEERPAVLRICQLVEGLPLGIELAATWVRTLSCWEIAQEIERGLGFLAASTRDVPERHRSIKAVFDHSWKLLSVEEQQVLRRLSIFRGGFHREAAEQVAGATLPLLSALIDKSLVRRNPVSKGRYDLHELIRQYAALLQLQEEPQEENTTRDRHALYYLTLVHSHEAILFSRRQKEALAELNAEIDNIRVSWEEAVTQQQFDLIRQTAVSLWYFYNVRNYFREGEILFGRAADMIQTRLATLTSEGAALEQAKLAGALADLWSHQAYFIRRQGRNAEAIKHYHTTMALLRSLHESETLAHTLTQYGALCWIIGEFDEAWRCLQESLPIFQNLKNEWQQGLCLAFMGVVAHERGTYTEAYHLLTEAMARLRVLGDPHIITLVGNFLSRTAQVLGRLAEVNDLLREGLRLTTETEDRVGRGFMLERMAVATQTEGDEVEARRLAEESVMLYREVGDLWSLARALNLLGHLDLARGDSEQARQNFNQALKTAVAAQVIPGALDALASLASLFAEEGNPEVALALTIQILTNPASTSEAKAQAGRLLREIEVILPPARLMAIQAQAQTRDFEALVAEILQ